MGWRGILRNIQAASRRAERQAHRRQRALAQQQLQHAQMQYSERVRHEVELYENQIELLTSVHKECGSEWGWHAIQSARPPAAPSREDHHERGARRALARYTPSIWDRLFGRTEAKRQTLQDAIDQARHRDKHDYEQAVEEYQAARADWQNSREFAARMLKGDFGAYTEAIRETNPFRDLAILGSSIKFSVLNAAAIHIVDPESWTTS